MKRLALLLLAGLLQVSVAVAQTEVCRDGRIVPDYGYQWTGCPGCLSSRLENGVQHTVYLAAPSLHGIRNGGPGAGKLKENDFLIAIDHLPITSLAALGQLERYQSGAAVVLTIGRGRDTLDVTIQPKPLCVTRQAIVKAMDVPAPSISSNAWFGFALSCGACKAGTGEQGIPHWNIPGPMLISAVERDGPAFRAGILVGDTLTAINGVSLRSEAGGRTMRSATPGLPTTFTLRRGGKELTLRVVPTRRENLSEGSGRDSLQYRGKVGGAEVEVSGNQADVSKDPDSGTLTIRGGGIHVIIRPSVGGR